MIEALSRHRPTAARWARARAAKASRSMSGRGPISESVSQSAKILADLLSDPGQFGDAFDVARSVSGETLCKRRAPSRGSVVVFEIDREGLPPGGTRVGVSSSVSHYIVIP